MGAVADFVEDVGDSVGDVFEAVGDAVEDVADAVLDVVEFVGTAVEKVIEDPLPTLLMIAGSAVGVPPWVTAGFISATRGGDLEDIVLAAGTSFVAGELKVEFIKSDIAGSISSTLIDEGVNSTIADVVATSIGSGLVAGTIAEIKGGDFGTGFSGGLVGNVVGRGFTFISDIVSDITASNANNALASDSIANNDFTAGFDSGLDASSVGATVGDSFSVAAENFDKVATDTTNAVNLNVDNGSGIPDYVVNDVVVANGGTDTPPITDTVAPVVADAPVVDTRPTSEISVLPSTAVADAPATVTSDTSAPAVALSDAPPAEIDNDFQALIDAAPDTNLGGGESAAFPATVADIAEEYPEDEPPPVVAPVTPETPAPPVVSGLESVSKGLTGVTSEPMIDDLISEGVVPETTSGGLNAVVPTETAGDLSATKEFKASDIVKPLVAQAGNLLKSSITKSLTPTKKPTPRPVGGLQAVKPVVKTSAPPPRQMDLSKLTPIKKAVPVKKPVPTGPARTLASNANLTPVGNIANLTSLVKKVG